MGYKLSELPARGRVYLGLGKLAPILLAPFGCLFILILFVLKPLVWVKIGRVSGHRIGHLSGELDLFLRRLQLGIYPDGPVYVFINDPRITANSQLLSMFARVTTIYDSIFLSRLFTCIGPLLKKTPFYHHIYMDSNELYEHKYSSPCLEFTVEERKRGEAILAEMGVDLSRDEFVSIFTRDSAFSKACLSNGSYDYFPRYSEIEELRDSVNYFLEKGWFVIRQGSLVEKPFVVKHPRYIDYSCSKYRSDFMDIFLMAHTKFLLGGSSGFSTAHQVFDTPVAWVNQLPVDVMVIAKHDIVIPKKVRRAKTKEIVPFCELGGMGINMQECYPKEYLERGLEFVDNNSQEILSLAMEMVARVEGSFELSGEDRKLKEAFYNQHKTSWPSTLCSTDVNIGTAWLRANKELYFKDPALVESRAVQ